MSFAHAFSTEAFPRWSLAACGEPDETTATGTPTATQRSTATAAPTDTYFTLDRVLDISIEIDPADRDILRHQTRTFEDLMAEIEEYGLSKPFADIYD